MISFTRSYCFWTAIILLLPATTSAINAWPHVWGSVWPLAQLLSVRWAGLSRAQSLLVAAQGGSAHIFDIISNCRSQDGQQVDALTCAQSVTVSAFAMALSVMAYQSTGTWTKRDVTAIDTILSLIPAEISDVKLHGQPVTDLSSMNIRKRQSDSEAAIDVHYNGTLPLTFILHHQVKDSNVTIPIFHATDGRRAQIHHIAPANSTELTKRGGFNGYNHVGAGGLKVQANSDPVAYWSDVEDWLYYASGNDQSPMSIILGYEHTSYMIGHAFETDVDNFYDGQFAMEEESNGFGTNFETNWNWCFGAYPTNCPDN